MLDWNAEVVTCAAIGGVAKSPVELLGQQIEKLQSEILAPVLEHRLWYALSIVAIGEVETPRLQFTADLYARVILAVKGMFH